MQGAANPVQPVENRFTIRQFFTSYCLRIPEYQRGYSWTKSHLSDLKDDIFNLIDLGQNQHYFGSLVVKPGDNINRQGDQPRAGYEIIDGQQRMTTTMLFLRAVHDKISQINPQSQHLQPILTLMDTGAINAGDPTYNLHLQRQNFRDCVENVLNGSAAEHTAANISAVGQDQKAAAKALRDTFIAGYTSGSQHRILEAYEYWIKQLDNETKRRNGENEVYPTDGEKEERLVEILQTYTDRFVIITIELSEHMEAPLVFEVMNNRGLDLSTLDLLKNLILLIDSRRAPDYRLINEEYREDCANQNIQPQDDPKHPLNFEPVWFDIVRELDKFGLNDRKNEERLLGIIWTIFEAGGRPDPSNAYTNIKKYFWKLTQQYNKDKDNRLREFISKLPILTNAYCEYFTKKNFGSFVTRYPILQNDQLEQYRQSTKMAIEDIRSMGQDGPYQAIIISAYAKTTSLQEFSQIVTEAEKSLFRTYRIKNRQSNFKLVQHGNEAKSIFYGPHPVIPIPSPNEDNNGIPFLPQNAHEEWINSDPEESRLMTAFEHTLNYLYKFTIGEGNHQAGASLESLREIWQTASQKAYSSDWATYFLFMYERAVNAGVERLSQQFMSGEKKFLNIEHIMPRSAATGGPDIYWTEEGDYQLPRFNAQELIDHVDDLGNLVLSRSYTNQHLYSDHSYDTKRDMYLNFGNADMFPFPPEEANDPPQGWDNWRDFTRVTEVAQHYQEWRVQCVIDRRKRLLNWAFRRWRFDTPIESDQQKPFETNIIAWHTDNQQEQLDEAGEGRAEEPQIEENNPPEDDVENN